ncbi:hypothetical protein D3P08_07240 [Paenibacillus nanensis]|uniref:Type 4 fimbrial biogenesis protein PilX N-terminal domain-containing protein n=1 Tax=Paenibacillus nanensis TaxID=393251 RepID=A0A3A1UZK9_9BACL|nr:hypothetical protein [Paenibacillus nanensis]RIX54039.1 hypothetical protein D3P08_07240 [Paenibacillus nanensis]
MKESRLRDERGYALMLVVFMILLFTLLGVSILGASLGGAVRTETKENDVQSLHLAERGLNEAVSYLVKEYDGVSDISDVELHQYMMGIEANPGKLMEDAVQTTNLSGAEAAKVTVEKVEQTSPMSYKVFITSEANVNGVIRKLEQEVRVDAFPDFLNYSFGSEQNVVLNGSPLAIGSVYAGGELKINNYAQYKYKTAHFLEKLSQYPNIIGTLYVQSPLSIKYADPTVVAADPNDRYVSIPQNDPDKLEELLGLSYDHIHIKDRSKFVSINVRESFLDKAELAVGRKPGVREELETALNVSTDEFVNRLVLNGVRRVAYRSEPALPNWDDEEAVERYEAERDDYVNNYLSLFNSKLTETIVFDDDLTLDGVAYKQLVYDAASRASNKWFIVNGDLNINNYSNEELAIQANILVTGKVTITGKGIRVDSTMFCLGEGEPDEMTIVQDAELKGYDSKQLVLLSVPPILLNRFDAFTNYGRYEGEERVKHRLDAFFYTEGTAELYGVGSSFWLNGGFFAKQQLTINAVLGNVTEAPDKPEGMNFDDQIFANELDSRFIIDYNIDIFNDQYDGLPRVNQLSVTLGSRKLVHESTTS